MSCGCLYIRNKLKETIYMNDFLHQLRSGNHKNYDRGRKPYDPNNRYRPSGQHPNTRDRRKPYQQGPFQGEQLAAIKKSLEEIVENQKQAAEIANRRVEVEERKARAMETIAAYVLTLTNAHQPPTAAPAADPHIAAEPTAAETAPTPEKPEKSDRQRAIDVIGAMRAEGVSYEKIARELERQSIPTLSGKGIWRGPSVQRVAKLYC
jgi:hypothetical protein